MSAVQRIIITPYLNTRAFVHHGAPAGCFLAPETPKQAVERMQRGEALAAVVPVAGLARLAGEVSLLGRFGIACRGVSRSVLLFSRQPFADIDGATRLLLSADSMSSVRLLFLLLSYRAADRGMPTLVASGGAFDAELVIGDAALRRAREPHLPYVTDLATQWFISHGRPMVFARWVIARGASRVMRARLAHWLADYAANEAALRQCAARADHARAGLDAASALDYLGGIRSVLDVDDLAGQAIYQRELARYPWPPALREPTPTTSLLMQA